jgi:HAD superfamily hydrolase (TIGR01509 family)
MPVRALLLDFDGVIADTENHHVAAWQRTFAAMGWDVPEAVCLRAMEVDDRELLAALFKERDLGDADVEGWVRRKQEVMKGLLADSPRVYPGVAALVERVRGSVKLGVVTTTWRANVDAVLGAAGLAPAFALVVAKEDVSAQKPDPEGYRKAVKALGVKPSEAWAVEDSASGLQAARGAKVNALAVGHRHPEGPWVGGVPFLPDLRQTDRVLETLGLVRGR